EARRCVTHSDELPPPSTLSSWPPPPLSLLLPLPPRSTLFPYTTLFRSLLDGRAPPGPVLIASPEAAHQSSRWYRGLSDEDRGPTDRKSTRLNSSHVAISYAVFCLKKKMRSGSSCPSRTILRLTNSTPSS